MIFLFIFFGLFFGFNLLGDNVIIFTIISVIVFAFAFFRFGKKIALFYIISLLIGFLLKMIPINTQPLSGTYKGIVIEVKQNYYIIWSKFSRYIIYEDDTVREVGDFITIKGSLSELQETALESEFSFKNYLLTKGVGFQLNVDEINIQFANFIKKNAYKKMFLGFFDEPARSLVDAFLFNTKNYENTILAQTNMLSISYLFSTSGVYLNVVLTVLEYFLFLKFSRTKSKIFSLALLSWYLIFVLNKISITRILILKIFSIINATLLKNKFSYLERVSIVSSTMIIINRYLALQSSFYIGIFLSLTLLFTKSIFNANRCRYSKIKLSLFLYFLLLPLSLSSDYEWHFFSFAFQIIMTPFTTLFAVSGLISFYSFPIRGYFNFLSTIISGMLNGLGYADISIPFREFSNYYVAIYYFLLFTIVYFFESFQKKHAFFVISLTLFMLIGKMIPLPNLVANSITFINVGQGDSCLVSYKNNNILIDTGGLTYKDIATEVTIPFLKKKGIWSIDYVFISHSDNDHCGALESLKKNYPIKNVIDTFMPFVVTIKDLKIENINIWADQFTDENDRSQVLKFRVANRNVLMMGDASETIEKKIIENDSLENFKVDLLKVGHHGSKTSSCKEFIEYVKPKEAIISVGANNYYGHPNESVLNILKNANIRYYRTDIKGSISYSA